MYPTLEVRWFYRGRVPPAVLTWYRARAGAAEGPLTRIDHYLRPSMDASSDALGVKLREGRVELKRRGRQYGIVRFHPQAAGAVAGWHKWRFALAETDLDSLGLPHPDWVAVEKARRLCKYQVGAGGQVVSVPLDAPVAQGCELELAVLRVAGQAWWTLCLETFGAPEGAPSGLRETLSRVAEHVFAEGEPPILAPESSYSYPGWLGVAETRD